MKYASVYLMLICAVFGFSPMVSAKSCHAASSQGQAGLSCGPAPVNGGVSQAAGQVTGTKPGQVGSPTIQTSNQNPPTRQPVTTTPDLPKAPIEGPKADPVLSPDPVVPPPAVSMDMTADVLPPVAPIIVAPPATLQLTPVLAPPQAPPAPTPQQAPMLIPPVVQQTAPSMPPPQVPQQTPALAPPLAPPTPKPQQTPMLIPPVVQQTAPSMPPPQVPQQTPVLAPPLAPPAPTPQQTPMLIPPVVQQAAPSMPPPQVPQQIPVAVPVPLVMTVPDGVNTSAPRSAPSGQKGAPSDYVTSRPRPLAATGPDKVNSAKQEPVLVSTADAATANQNEKMITVMPGRQLPNQYPSFSVNSATPNRTCIVSGMERRKTVQANGVETYQGTLPTFRMIVTELADIPAWHPLDSGCVISVTHKR